MLSISLCHYFYLFLLQPSVPFPLFPYLCFLLHTQTASLKHIQMQIAAHPHTRWDLELWRRSMPDLKDRTGKRTPKGGAEKFRAWVIEQTATFHHQNSNEQLFRKKKRALNRVDLFQRVKSQRWGSNRPLIFLSCIKGTILLGGYAGEQACLIFTVYLMLPANVYIYLIGISPQKHHACFVSPMHMDTKPLRFSSIVSVCACQEDYSIFFPWKLLWLS